MVTWGVTDAGVSPVGCDLDIGIEADDWVGHSPTGRPALIDGDHGGSISASSRVNTPITGSTTRLTIPATTARLKDEETTRLADHSFPLSEGSCRLSCTVSSTRTVGTDAAETGSTTIVTQFQGPATLHRRERSVQLSFDRPTPVTIRVTGADSEVPTVTVPLTPEGIAAGLSAMTVAHDCRGPGRSHPARRAHPPLVKRPR